MIQHQLCNITPQAIIQHIHTHKNPTAVVQYVIRGCLHKATWFSVHFQWCYFIDKISHYQVLNIVSGLACNTVSGLARDNPKRNINKDGCNICKALRFSFS